MHVAKKARSGEVLESKQASLSVDPTLAAHARITQMMAASHASEGKLELVRQALSGLLPAVLSGIVVDYASGPHPVARASGACAVIRDWSEAKEPMNREVSNMLWLLERECLQKRLPKPADVAALKPALREHFGDNLPGHVQACVEILEAPRTLSCAAARLISMRALEILKDTEPASDNPAAIALLEVLVEALTKIQSAAEMPGGPQHEPLRAQAVRAALADSLPAFRMLNRHSSLHGNRFLDQTFQLRHLLSALRPDWPVPGCKDFDLLRGVDDPQYRAEMGVVLDGLIMSFESPEGYAGDAQVAQMRAALDALQASHPGLSQFARSMAFKTVRECLGNVSPSAFPEVLAALLNARIIAQKAAPVVSPAP